MKLKLYICLAVLILIASCKDRYDPGIDYPVTGYLVIEGFINSGVGATSIRLSRTAKLTDTGRRYELNATVTVEGNDNSRYVLGQQPNGLYVNNQLTLDRSKKFRLHIRTSNGREYFSDYASPIYTPPIDSVNYTLESPGMVIHINTHDPRGNTRYYTWNYEETWEINARDFPKLKYIKNSQGMVTGLAYLYPTKEGDTTGFRCWQFENSTTIITGSTVKLTQDLINLPLISIPYGSEKMSVLYSVKVYQHALSEKGYDFLQRMKKNTQQVGSIFDAQPSELSSNVHNTTNPAEIIIGYIDVADAQEMRIFIDPRQRPIWPFSLTCEDKQVDLVPDSLSAYSYLDPVDYGVRGTDPVLQATSRRCADCRMAGINVRPTYWPR